eukprot:4595504-Prorocentrum_lima.AAC.1
MVSAKNGLTGRGNNFPKRGRVWRRQVKGKFVDVLLMLRHLHIETGTQVPGAAEEREEATARTSGASLGAM